MDKASLSDIYHGYIDCLNAQDWQRLGQFVHKDAEHNGQPFGLPGYRAMLERDFDQIPDLRFNIALLVCEPPFVASRLDFHCSPRGDFLGLPVNGRRVSFSENVYYEFVDGKIVRVWSIVDKLAVERQLATL